MIITKSNMKKILENIRKELLESKQLFIEKCREDIDLPSYSNKGDAGMDIRAAENKIILPGQTVVIPTGLKVVIPEGYELQIRPRSGLSLNTPLRIVNSPGTIDSGYRDEVGVILSNTSPVLSQNIYNDEYGYYYFVKIDSKKGIYEEDKNSLGCVVRIPTYNLNEKHNKYGVYQIKKGDRIAQIVLSKFETIEFNLVENVKSFGLNRGGGFGHSGIN